MCVCVSVCASMAGCSGVFLEFMKSMMTWVLLMVGAEHAFRYVKVCWLFYYWIAEKGYERKISERQ